MEAPLVLVFPQSGTKGLIHGTNLLSNVDKETHCLCQREFTKDEEPLFEDECTDGWQVEITLKSDEYARFKNLPRNLHIGWIFGDAYVTKCYANSETGQIIETDITDKDLVHISNGIAKLCMIFRRFYSYA